MLRKISAPNAEHFAGLVSKRDLENPPSLEMLSQEIGCSTSHLCRIFTDETGGTIPKYLRTKRIELAAELLRAGKVNVTKATTAVCYASLRAFDKAFVEPMGYCPVLYPPMTVAGRKRDSGDKEQFRAKK